MVPREDLTETETGPDGRYSLAVGTPSMVELTVSAPGRLAMSLGPFLETRSVELPPLVLPAAEEILVAAVDSAGEPLPGRRLVARPTAGPVAASGWRPAIRRYVTDDEGGFTVHRQVGEELELLWSDRALETYVLPVGVAQQVLEAPEAASRDRLEVRNGQGRPLAGVVVWVAGWGEPLGMTDAAGMVGLPHLGGGRSWPLQLSGPGGSSAEVSLAPTDEDGTVYEVRLPHQQSFRGVVVLEGGKVPIGDAIVWAGVDPGRLVVTDDRGRFELASHSGPATFVQAHAPGFEPRLEWLSRGTEDEGIVIRLAPTTPVVGRVLDDSGRAASGVAVSAREVKRTRTSVGADPFAARAVTGSGGRFRLEGLAVDRAYKLVAERRPAGWADVVWTVGAPGGPELKLASPANLTGRVLDLEGNGIEGVKVRLSMAAESGEERRWSADTASTGGFLLTDLPPGLCELELDLAGFAPLRLRRVRLVAGQQTAVGDLVLRPGAQLAVRVATLDGTAIPRARVELLEPSGRWRAKLLFEGFTGKDGRLHVDDLGQDRVLRLRVVKEGYLEERRRAARAGGAEIEVVLRPAGAVRGRVTSTDGVPMRGARVALNHAEPLSGVDDRAMRPGRQLEGAETEEDGVYEIVGIPPGELTLWVLADGHVPSAERSLTIEEGEVVEDIDFELDTGAVVFGEVIDSDGLPVPRSRVAIGEAGTFADQEGHYRVTGVPLGPQTVAADHPDYGRAFEEIEIGEGDNRLTLTLPKGEEIIGEALDSGGRSVPGAYVTLRVPGPGGRFYSTVADGEGLFRFPAVAEGEYRLAGEARGYADALVEVPVVVPGAGDHPWDLVFERGVRVTGRILGLDVTALSDVRLDAVSETRPARAGVVDFDGVFEIRNLRPGRWLLRASLRDGTRQAQRRVVLDRDDEEVERDIEFGGQHTLAGQVVYGDEGLGGVDVTLTGGRLAVARRLLTDQDGRFEIEDLAPGPYRLGLRHVREQLVHNEELFVESDLEVTIRLEPGSLSGVLMDGQSRAPIGGGLIALRRLVTTPGEFPNLITGGSEDDGSFYLPRVPAGFYALTAHRDGYSETTREIEISSGLELSDLEIVLEPTQGLAMRVSATGQLPRFVNVRLTNRDTGQTLGQSRGVDEDGLCLLPTVPPGEWDVVVGGDGSSLTVASASVPGPPIDVRLPPGSELMVHIADLADSDQLATATVVGPDQRTFQTLAQGGIVKSTWTVRAGLAVIEGVPPGTWTVRALAPDGRSWSLTVLAQGEARIPVDLR